MTPRLPRELAARTWLAAPAREREELFPILGLYKGIILEAHCMEAGDLALGSCILLAFHRFDDLGEVRLQEYLEKTVAGLLEGLTVGQGGPLDVVLQEPVHEHGRGGGACVGNGQDLRRGLPPGGLRN